METGKTGKEIIVKIELPQLEEIIRDQINEVLSCKDDAKSDFVSVKKASEYLGVTEQSLYSYVKQNKLKQYKSRSGKLYFSVKDLREFIGINEQ